MAQESHAHGTDECTLMPISDKVKAIRHIPPREAEVPVRPGEPPPLVDPKGPKEQQLKAIWHAKVDLFDLKDDQQRARYEEILQKIVDKKAYFHKEVGPHFDVATGKCLVLLRWVDIEFKV